MKNKKIFLILIVLGFIAYSFYDYKSKSKSFVVTPNTKIDPNSELAKYVTQQEIDDFAFRYWNIAEEADHKDENETQKALRHLLEAKQTDKVLNFLKDNNLSVDTKLQANTTPLMYSAFYDDENTTKELIKLGANIRAKDNYKLSPMAYAIENNATKVVKILFDNGVKFDESLSIQTYYDFFIEKVIENGKNQTIVADFAIRKSKDSIYAFEYIIRNNWLEMVELVLKSGFTYGFYFIDDKNEIRFGHKIEDVISVEELIKNSNGFYKGDTERFKVNLSVYERFFDNWFFNDYEPMLDLLLKYNVSAYFDEKFMNTQYKNCISRYTDAMVGKFYYIFNKKFGIDELREYRLSREYRDKYCQDGACSSDYVKKKLIETKKIRTKMPLSLDLYDIMNFDREIEFYDKLCGDSNFKFVDLTTTERIDKFKQIQKDRNGTFDNIKDYIAYKNFYDKNLEILRIKEKYPDYVFIVDKNITYKEYLIQKLNNSETTETEKCNMKKILHLDDKSIKCWSEY